jgi:hypothetical protein
MPYKDEYGITHPVMSDEINAWASAHIDNCPLCMFVFGGVKYSLEEWEKYVAVMAPPAPKKFKYDDLYLNEPGEVDCQVCGAKIVDTDKHLEWHNKPGG